MREQDAQTKAMLKLNESKLAEKRKGMGDLNHLGKYHSFLEKSLEANSLRVQRIELALIKAKNPARIQKLKAQLEYHKAHEKMVQTHLNKLNRGLTKLFGE